jgi:hypothetical protein
VDSPQLHRQAVRIHRALGRVHNRALGRVHNRATIFLLFAGCSSIAVKHEYHDFPRDRAFVNEVTRSYSKIGVVRSKVDFPSLDAERDEDKLCKNYYNKAVSDLVKMARDKGADAVIDVRSVVFLENGQTEIHKTPECSDDGREGQILAQGVAVKWSTPEVVR